MAQKLTKHGVVTDIWQYGTWSPTSMATVKVSPKETLHVDIYRSGLAEVDVKLGQRVVLYKDQNVWLIAHNKQRKIA
jgi:hypothetical protein